MVVVLISFRAWQRLDTDLSNFGRFTAGSIIYSAVASLLFTHWLYGNFVRPRLKHRRYHNQVDDKLDNAANLLWSKQIEQANSKYDAVVWCHFCQAFNVVALQGRATCSWLLGRYGDAIDDWKIVCELLPDDHNAMLNLASLLAGSPDDSDRDLRESERLLDEIDLLAESTDGTTFGIRAAIHAERGEFAAAVESYQKMMKANPDTSHAEESLAKLKFGQTLRCNPETDRARYFESLDL